MEIGVALTNELENRISEEFCIFDTHGDKFMDTRNVGNVLRFLGCVPTEKEVNEVIAATESTEYPGETHLSAFMSHVSQLLMEHKMQPADPQTILNAFKVLDPENKQFLTREYFGKLMVEEGEPFDEEEMAEMWPVAVDPITDNIPYEFYINQLKHKADIYLIAEMTKEEIASREKERKKAKDQARVEEKPKEA